MCSPIVCRELLLPCVHSGLEAMPEKNVSSFQQTYTWPVRAEEGMGDGRKNGQGFPSGSQVPGPDSHLLAYGQRTQSAKRVVRAARLGCMGFYHLKICVGPPSPQLQFSWWGIYASMVWENAKTDKAHSMTFGIILPWTPIPATH